MDRFNVIVRRGMIETFQEMLRAVRVLMQLSQEDMGEYVGLSAQEISNFESGEEQMPPSIFLALASFVEDFLIKNPGLRSAFDKILTPKFDDADIQQYFNSILGQMPAYFLVQTWIGTFSHAHGQLTKMPEEPLTDQDFNNLIYTHKFFMDETVVMHPAFQVMMSRLSPFFKESSSVLSIPSQVIDMLREQFESDNIDKIEAMIVNYCDEHVIQLFGEGQDGNIKEILESTFRDDKDGYRFALITQDAYFASDILDLNHDMPWKDPILTLYINEGNDLVLYDERSMTNNELCDFDFENFSDISDAKNSDACITEFDEEIIDDNPREAE